jgi:Protein of unknown function (DUF1573)
MKKIFLLFVIATISSFTFAQNASSVIKFEKEVYDFGTIQQGVPVTYAFNFKNISKAPLVIESAVASCGCTTPTWPQKPVMANKKNAVNAGFNAAAAGVFEKTITVKIQGVPLPVEIKIKGNVLSKEDYAKLPAKGKAKKA